MLGICLHLNCSLEIERCRGYTEVGCWLKLQRCNVLCQCLACVEDEISQCSVACVTHSLRTSKHQGRRWFDYLCTKISSMLNMCCQMRVSQKLVTAKKSSKWQLYGYNCYIKIAEKDSMHPLLKIG